MSELTIDFDEIDEDPRQEYLEQIAEGMATLSEASEAPTGVTAASESFSAAEVDFASDAWVNQLSQVQGWLSVDDLPLDSREDFFTALAAALGLDAADAIIVSDGSCELTNDALDALSARIQSALSLQSDFLQDREQGTALSTATSDWEAKWEELTADSEPTNPLPVKAKTEVWSIQNLLTKINLAPSYQRGDVWNNNDRSALIESVLRGIPLPSVILLRNPDGKPKEVVDGKQRLTSIQRFVGVHPIALQKLDEIEQLHPNANFKNLFKEDYPAFKRKWKTEVGEVLTAKKEDEFYFPFKLRGSKQSTFTGTELDRLKGKYYTQIQDEAITVADEPLTVAELFNGPTDYKVPVIEYTQAAPSQIHEVFKLYNKQGVHLNAEELRNAMHHEVELTRAVLFAAGDADQRRSVSEVAPSLATVADLHRIKDSLTGYKFGIARYRRSKVLAWVIAVLVFDSGKPLASTSTHTNLMLSDLGDKDIPSRPLRRPEVIADLFTWLARAITLHSERDYLWAPKFMGGKSDGSWQELQLVGTLIGVALATIARPDDIEDLVSEHAEEIRRATESPAWKRPRKTQTRDQWDYIARLARDILAILGIDGAAASQIVRERFGLSGYEQLQGMIFTEDA